ncbi:ABC transporter ATP-binding protein [Planctomycetota bacterium]
MTSVTQPLVSIGRLGKRFGALDAVRDLSLDVEGGEIFALLGPNGAGKTTTIRMLMGILQPTTGTATIDGLDCFAQRAEVMRRVGYLPDEPVFYDYLRGREILHFAGEMHGLPAKAIAARIALLAERLTLADDLDEYAANYSRGMKKKLASILALLHEPKLLILDEPTDGLDPYATRTMHTLIRERAEQGGSVFFSTHLLDQAEKLCTRVGILFRGRLRVVRRLDELRAAQDYDGSVEEIFFAATADGADAIDGGEPEDRGGHR